MKEHGLLFRPEMVLAFLEHRKSMTRRTGRLKKLNENPADWELINQAEPEDGYWLFRNKATLAIEVVKCPYAVGDRIYAKETYMLDKEYDNLKPSEIPKTGRKVAIWYYADGNYYADKVTGGAGKVRSAMFMPKWVARIWREIVGISCQRVQDITEEDAMAEGIKGYLDLRWQFAGLWERLNSKKHPWSKNEWVWVLSLKEVKE